MGQNRGANDFSRPYIQTFSGRQFFYDDLYCNEFAPEDMAHASSMRCRFGGHCREFYSNAQHEVYSALMAPGRLAFAALIHDEPETYMGVDMPSPLKAWLRGDPIDIARHIPASARNILKLEKQIERALHRHFKIDLSVEDRALLKTIDRKLVMTEGRDLMPPRQTDECWFDDTPYPWPVKPRAPADIEAVWLRLFHMLAPQ